MPASVDTAERTARPAAAAVSWAHDTLGLSFRDLGAVLHAHEGTVRRWRGTGVIPRARFHVKLAALHDLRDVLGEVFEAREEIVEWLDTPLAVFRGRSPVTMLRQGCLEDVVDVLAAMESGVYV